MGYNLEMLRKLESRISEAKGPSQELNADIWVITGGPSRRNYHYWRGCQPKGESPTVRNYALDRAPNLTGSLDAAIALIERVLPGAEWQVSTLYGRATAELPLNQSELNNGVFRDDSNVSLALCLALIRALIAKESPR